MIRRLFWWAVGVVSGSLFAVWTLAGVARFRRLLHGRPDSPPGGAVARSVVRVQEAVHVGRTTKADYERRRLSPDPRSTVDGGGERPSLRLVDPSA